MKKVAVLNDTRTQYHHGCELVMRQLENKLNEKGIAIHCYLNEGDSWKDNKLFFEQLKDCDGIVVNGEGTIHHGRPAGKLLVEISSVAEQLDIPCFLINTTFQSNPDEYSQYLQKFNRIFVRESYSQRELSNLGVKSYVVPDLTLSYEGKFSETRRSFGVTDSAMTPISEALFELCNDLKGQFLPVLRSSQKDGDRKSTRLNSSH